MAEGHDSKAAREAFEAAEQKRSSPVPAAEHGTHSKSHAAHLDADSKAHLTPEGDGKQGREPGSLKEPPQDPRTRNTSFHNR